MYIGVYTVMLYLWNLPGEVIWHILTYLEVELTDLYNFSTAFKTAHYVLVNEGTWYRFMRRRFTVIPNWDALDAHVHRLDSLRHIYHRLREVNNVLNEIHDNIAFRLYRKFGSILSERLCYSKSGDMLNILKSFTNTYIVYNVYAVKRDFYYLMQSQNRVSQGSGLSLIKRLISNSAECFSVQLHFSGNSIHFERVEIPVLFDQLSVCRDVDILFKEEFFRTVTIEVRNRVGYCLKHRREYSADPHCLRQDYSAVAAFCFSMVEVYFEDSELRCIKEEYSGLTACVGADGVYSRGYTIADIKPVSYSGRVDFLRELLE